MNVKKTAIIRQETLKKLNRYGIKGVFIYLIDVIPLIEIMWADGKAQDGEISILKDYLQGHVQHINKLAGYKVLTYEVAHGFVSRYLQDRPDPELLRTLRSLVAPVRLSSSETSINVALRESLLATCLDIASSSVLEYPYGTGERFNPAEKKCFFEILESL